MRARWGWALGASVSLGIAAPAAASSGLDSPEIGVKQVGRGSAWVARADDATAAYFNPAALAYARTELTLGVHLMALDACYARKGPGNEPVSPGNNIPGPGAEGGPPEAVCAAGDLFPNPHLAASFRLSESFGIGLSLGGPHAAGKQEWPETVTYERNGIELVQPAPQRYLLVEADNLLVAPTLSVGYAPIPKLAFGAGFIWGVASIDYTLFAESVSPNDPNPADNFDAHQDVKARLTAKDLFVPGFVLGMHASPFERLDFGAWFKWQDALDAAADVHTNSHYFKPGGAVNEGVYDRPENTTDVEDAGRVHVPIPMEARVGFRYHHPREGGPATTTSLISERPAGRVRDPMAEDLFDVEVDVTWAHNGQIQDVEIAFRGDPSIGGDPILVKGAEPGVIMPDARLPKRWKDVLGVRLGGEFVALQNLLALRAGAFVETKGQDDEYLHLDFVLAERLGLSGGATVRLGPVDVSAAYQHTFYGTIDNGGDGAVKALSGDVGAGFRSRQAVNGGRLETNLDEVALGATLRL